jgi:hypothetical protein
VFNRVEMHPLIKNWPFSGHYEAHFIIRPPAPTNPLVSPGRLNVSYQFTVRSGCNVSVTAVDATAVRVVVTFDQGVYTLPLLPPNLDKTRYGPDRTSTTWNLVMEHNIWLSSSLTACWAACPRSQTWSSTES